MKKKSNSFTDNLLKIATIISTTVSCLRLLFMGILSIKLALGIIFAVVIFLAIGNSVSKFVLAIFGLVLFMLVFGSKFHGGQMHFFTGILTIIVTLLVTYFVLKKLFE